MMVYGGIQQFFWSESEPLDGRVDPGPFFSEKLPAFGLQEQIARAGIDEHAKTSLALDQLLVDQPLICLQNRERIDPLFRRDMAHRRQRIAFLEHAVENHGNDTVTQLPVDRLIVVKLMIHPVFRMPLTSDMRGILMRGASYSVVVNYNTASDASLFLTYFCRLNPAPSRSR